MDLLELRTHAVDAIAAGMPAGLLRKVEVVSHPGRFELAEIERYAAKAPSIRVALISATDREQSEAIVDVELAAYVLTKNGKGGLADAQGLMLGTLVISRLRAPLAFESPTATAPRAVVCRNLYNSQVGEEGIALHAVTWKQTLTLPDVCGEASLADFATLFQEIDLAPAGGAIDAADQIQLPAA